MYKVNETLINSKDGEFITYGISYIGGEINDISLNKNEIKDFVNLLNSSEVSVIHIDEVVEDFLAS